MDIQSTTPGIIMILVAAVSALLAAIAWRKRHMPGGLWFFFLIVSTFFWCLLCGIEDMVTGQSEKILFSKMAYPAIAGESVLWFTFIIKYIHWDRWFTGKKILLLWIIPAAVILAAFTNELHGLVWPDFVRATADPRSRLIYGTGPLKLTIALYSYALILTSNIIVFYHIIHSGGVIRKQYWALAFSSIFPWLSHILYMTGSSPQGLDLTPIAFTAMIAIILWSLVRIKLFDLMPVAYDLLFRNMSDGALVLDDRGRLVEFNKSARHFLGLTQNAIGTDAVEALAEWPDLIGKFRGMDEGSTEVRINEGNTARWFDVRVSNLPDKHGRIAGQMFVFRDISVRKNLEQELTQFATTDTLTGSFNRRMGFAVLDKQIKLVRRMKAPLSVCYIDIDGLKTVNDRFGHQEGDSYITLVSRIIRDSIGELDSLSRLGGDEFLIILPQCTGEQAGTVWKRIRQRIDETNKRTPREYSMGASCGISELLPNEQLSADELVERADRLMYEEKKSKKR